MTTSVRATLGNGAQSVRRDEIAELRIERTPIKALVSHTRGAAKIPMTIILTASNLPDANHPDYGLAYIQNQPGNTVRWRLVAGAGNERWIEGHRV